MEEILSCPMCHTTVRETDYFCFNCGKNLKPKPPSTNIVRLLLILLGSIFLPPIGIIWGWPYIKQTGSTYRLLGLFIIGSTLISFVATTYLAVDYAHKLNMQVNEELMKLQGF